MHLLRFVVAFNSFLTASALTIITKPQDELQYHLVSTKIIGNLAHFWRSTGLSPPSFHQDVVKDFLLSLEERINIALIGSLPNSAIKQVRIHWLLNLVTASVSGGQMNYNFTLLDKLLDHLYHAGLNPGFELMGNPSNLFDNFENKTQVYLWKKMVHDLGLHYAKRYGIERVSEWNWESWNEPDHHDFGNINFTQKGFLNYFDASRKGLKSAWKDFKFGGPGGSCRDPNFSRLCWKLLQHCNDDSASDGCKMDYISFHKKGSEDVDSILAKERKVMRKITESYPNLSNASFYNDEGDFLKGWWKSKRWKANSVYAAMVAKSITDHAHFSLRNPRYKLLSFDNGFLNDLPNYHFTQRTLFARFSTKITSHDGDVVFFKKPSYQIMALVSLLGNKIVGSPRHLLRDHRISLLATSRNDINPPRKPRNRCIRHFLTKETKTYPLIGNFPSPIYNRRHRFPSYMTDLDNENSALGRFNCALSGLMSSGSSIKKMKTKWKIRSKNITLGNAQITFLVSFTNNTQYSRELAEIDIKVKLSPNFLHEPIFVAIYDIGNHKIGPFEAWEMLGKPVSLSRKDIASIRSFEGVDRLELTRRIIQNPWMNLKLNLTLGSVKLVHICSSKNLSPPQVSKFSVGEVTSSEILFVWSDENISTRCVDNYEVHKSTIGQKGPFHRISKGIILENNFFYSFPLKKGIKGAQGWYTVRATLYNGIRGPFAKPIYFP